MFLTIDGPIDHISIFDERIDICICHINLYGISDFLIYNNHTFNLYNRLKRGLKVRQCAKSPFLAYGIQMLLESDILKQTYTHLSLYGKNT